jgi:hypothetical protein
VHHNVRDLIRCRAGRRMVHRQSLYRRSLMAAPGWNDQDQDWASRPGAYADPPGDRLARDRTRASTPLASQTYQGERFQLVVAVVLGAAGLVAGIVALVMGEVLGLFLLGFGCWSVLYGIWTPHRLTLDDSGVLLEAVVRRISIPWDELQSVGPSWWDIRHQSLRWGRRRGLAVLTLQAFPDLHRILVEIERRSPRTYVSS